MKQILVAVVVVMVLLFSGNYYYGRQVERHLQSAAVMMSSMGGHLAYTDVSISLGGEVQIDDVIVSAPGLDDPLYIDRVALRTGSVLGVHMLAMDTRKQRIPEQLGLTMEGMRMPLGGSSYRQMSALGSVGESLLAAGCGEREYFSAGDFAEMGYGSSSMVTTHADFRLINDGGWLEVEARTVAEQMYEVSAKLDISLDANSRDAQVVTMAMLQAQLNEISFNYVDRGYIPRVLEFCQQQHNVQPSEYIAQHLQAWQNALREHGLEAGENTVSAYKEFLAQPQSFAISARPSSELSFGALAGVDPELLLYQFRTTLAVNQNDFVPLDVTAMDQAALQAWRATQSEQQPMPEPVTESVAVRQKTAKKVSTKSQVIALQDLHDHLNDLVAVRLTSGRTVEGRIRRLDEDTLQLHSYQNGGSMTIPLPYSQIYEVRLR